MRRMLPAAMLVLVLGACSTSPRRLTVAAASDLVTTFAELGPAFQQETGVEAVMTFGSTSALARQIAAGAPVDVYTAADTQHPDELVASGYLRADSRALFARGQLAVWAPDGGVARLEDLKQDRFRFIAIAEPNAAPYGSAAVAAMQSAGLYEDLRSKLVFAGNVSQAKQFAATGNADAAFVAYSLVFREPGSVLLVDLKLYPPLLQALGVVAGSPHEAEARQFTAFLLGPRGQAILRQNGYLPAK